MHWQRHVFSMDMLSFFPITWCPCYDFMCIAMVTARTWKSSFHPCVQTAYITLRHSVSLYLLYSATYEAALANGQPCISHRGRDNMASILQRTFANVFSCMTIVVIWFQFWVKWVPNDPISNKSSLVQIMAWRRTGDKPLSGPMMTYVIDGYWHHLASMFYM